MNSRRAAALLIGIGWLGAPGAAPANPAGSLPPTVVIPAPGEPADGLAVRPDRGGADDPSAVASAEAPGPDEASPAVPAREAAGAELPGPSGVSQEAAAIEPPEPGPAPDPLRDLPPADLPEAGAIFRPSDPVSRALLERLQGEGLLHPRLARKEREAMLAFYALGDFKPVWIREGAWTPAAQAVRDRLRKADEDALDPAAYAVPDLAAPPRDDVAGADLRLSVAAVLYARDARGARIDPSRLSRLITPKLDLPAADAVLTALAAAAEPGATLQAFNPPHAGYLALRRKLAEVRANRSAARNGLPQKVAARRGAWPRAAAPAPVEADLIANMERWRWLPADLGRRHVAVNLPEFRLRIRKDGATVHEARVIVGRPETPTPIFSGTMEYAIVNPSWTVPPSILNKEFLPRMARDPSYAARRGYQVIRRGGKIMVRQPPGERNALGFIKFMFPNQHAVYLHDTPNRSLFSAERRAFSHGCVRVDQPFRLADVVLGSGWPESRLRGLIGRGERTINLPERLPVHLTYFTHFVDERGAVRSLGDLYGVNRRVRLALGLGG